MQSIEQNNCMLPGHAISNLSESLVMYTGCHGETEKFIIINYIMILKYNRVQQRDTKVRYGEIKRNLLTRIYNNHLNCMTL